VTRVTRVRGMGATVGRPRVRGVTVPDRHSARALAL